MSRILALLLSIVFLNLSVNLLRSTLRQIPDAHSHFTFHDVTVLGSGLLIFGIVAGVLFWHERYRANGRLFSLFNRVCLAAALVGFGANLCLVAFNAFKAA